MDCDTPIVRQEGAVLLAAINSPPMNLLGPELVRDLVSLIQRAEADGSIQVLVFKSLPMPTGKALVDEAAGAERVVVGARERSTLSVARSRTRFFARPAVRWRSSRH